MSYPVGPKPEGAWELGDSGAYGSTIEEDNVESIVTSGAVAKWEDAQNSHRVHVRSRIDGAYDAIQVVEGHADDAISQATAAINTANAAEATAASAMAAVSYWETEFVVASAAVVLGVNELLIGPCQNVPGGLDRIITDMHIAFLSQPNGLTFELKKWNPDGTESTVLGTYTLPAGATRASWAINYNVTHRERLFINVTSVTGSVAPQVIQILVFGAFVEETP
ncbi:hypothetical protein ACFU44_00305 [Nocardia rhizosphaerihabitans]|uniref:hypothetical protein n=1 Tax=Nocardia rhizosphaerihabitans TaxID=1691570 RepID=UPI00366DE729